MSQPLAHSPARDRVLVVDKENCMRQMMEQVLAEHFQVVTACSAEEGLSLVESEAPFDIIISSLTQLRMNGLEFLCQVCQKYPATVRVLMTSGFSDDVAVSQAFSAGHITRLVLKPFSIHTFLEQLKTDLASRSMPDP